MRRGVITAALVALSLGLAACERESWPSEGRWQDARPIRISKLDAEQQVMIERLEAIGYAGGSRPPTSERTITAYDRSRTRSGVNFYTSGHAPVAILMDMEGKPLHRWSLEFDQVWSVDEVPKRDRHAFHSWRRARLLPNGNVLAIFEGIGLIEVDRASRLQWARRNGAHHDLDVTADGLIYVLTREAHIVSWVNENEPILEDFIVILDSSGEELRRVSLLDALENSEYRELWRGRSKSYGDLFHTNSLVLLDGSGAERNAAFRAGNVLVSMRTLDAIAVVDLEVEKVVWALRGDFRQQHDPKVITNGNLLLFDNRGLDDASRVLELDVTDGSVVWQYSGDDATPLYSEACGTAERLLGGNTLITESDQGRAFEVDPDGRILWEFYSPHRAGSKRQFVATLFDVVRLPADFSLDWLSTTVSVD